MKRFSRFSLLPTVKTAQVFSPTTRTICSANLQRHKIPECLHCRPHQGTFEELCWQPHHMDRQGETLTFTRTHVAVYVLSPIAILPIHETSSIRIRLGSFFGFSSTIAKSSFRGPQPCSSLANVGEILAGHILQSLMTRSPAMVTNAESRESVDLQETVEIHGGIDVGLCQRIAHITKRNKATSISTLIS